MINSYNIKDMVLCYICGNKIELCEESLKDIKKHPEEYDKAIPICKKCGDRILEIK